MRNWNWVPIAGILSEWSKAHIASRWPRWELLFPTYRCMCTPQLYHLFRSLLAGWSITSVSRDGYVSKFLALIRLPVARFSNSLAVCWLQGGKYVSKKPPRCKMTECDTDVGSFLCKSFLVAKILGILKCSFGKQELMMRTSQLLRCLRAVKILTNYWDVSWLWWVLLMVSTPENFYHIWWFSKCRQVNNISLDYRKIFRSSRSLFDC